MSVVVWLTGCRGMLGTEVGRLLAGAGVKLQATDSEVDISDAGAVKRFSEGHRFDWIVNCAAYTAVDRAEDEPEAAFRINADGPANLAAVARDRGAALIHISTDYVFDGAKEGEYSEDDPPNPLCMYGKSKLTGELRVRESLGRHFIIRTAWLYGRHGVNFASTMLRLFRERERVGVVDDQCGTPTFAVDLAEFIAMLVKRNSSDFGTYHFTNEGGTTWYGFACEIRDKARTHELLEKDVEIVPIKTSEYPAKAKRPMNSLLSKKKIKAVFGTEIRSWQKALDEYMLSVKRTSRVS